MFYIFCVCTVQFDVVCDFAQLSTDAVSALRKVSVLIRLWKQPSAESLKWLSSLPILMQESFWW